MTLNKLSAEYASENILTDDDQQPNDNHEMDKKLEMFELEAALKTNIDTSPQ